MQSEADRHLILTVDGLGDLIEALRGHRYRVVGPTVRDGVIAYAEVSSLDDLPRGWTDEQSGGRYRLLRRNDEALFGYAVGPQSWKPFLHPPLLPLWRAQRNGRGMQSPADPQPPRFAFIGVRACELHAIAIQDRVLLGGAHADPHYRLRRQDAFMIAVNCGVAGGTCFCASMNSGPRAPDGFDLALTELLSPAKHVFLLEIGTEAGRQMLAETPQGAGRAATAQELAEAQAIVARTARHMGRTMRTDDLRDLLMRNLEHPRWNEVADRCLTCGNCTMVCPTCFCTSVEDSSDLAGLEVSRSRRWDSCFTTEFSYLHGGGVRQSARSRYRQWMTHKLATWHDQFGGSGCVGCGRCITWCPVGIDITEEVRAIREGERPRG